MAVAGLQSGKLGVALRAGLITAATIGAFQIIGDMTAGFTGPSSTAGASGPDNWGPRMGLGMGSGDVPCACEGGHEIVLDASEGPQIAWHWNAAAQAPSDWSGASTRPVWFMEATDSVVTTAALPSPGVASGYIRGALTAGSFIPGPAGSLASLAEAGLDLMEGKWVYAGIGVVAAGIGLFTNAGVVKGAARFAYRGLAKGENISAGLVARAPGAGNSPISHVAGKIESQWISATTSLSVATEKYGANGIVRIDLTKVDTQVLDISRGFPNGGRMSNWAIRDQEILIRDRIPANALERLR